MVTFTVHQPPGAPADLIDRAAELTFVRDGFSWTALSLAPLWLLANGLWLALLIYAGLIGVAVAAVLLTSVPDAAIGFIYFGLNLLTAFEAGSIKRWSLERRGWTMLGTVTGSSVLDCERRFFDSWLPGQPKISMGDGPHGRLSPAGGSSRWSSLPWGKSRA